MKLLWTTRALLYYFDPHFMLFLYSVCMSVWSSTGHSVTSVVNKSRAKASRSQFRSPPGRNLLKSGTARLARTLRLTVTCSAVAVPIAAARSPLYYLFCRSLIARSARLCPPSHSLIARLCPVGREVRSLIALQWAAKRSAAHSFARER